MFFSHAFFLKTAVLNIVVMIYLKPLMLGLEFASVKLIEKITHKNHPSFDKFTLLKITLLTDEPRWRSQVLITFDIKKCRPFASSKRTLFKPSIFRSSL